MYVDPNESNERQNNAYALRAGYVSVLVVCVLIAVKAFAYYYSSSAGILSSLTDSLTDSVVSLMALVSIIYASRPADEDHRWGHGKMEGVSALFQASVIAGGGVFLVFESLRRLAEPPEISHHMIGVGVMMLSVILSAMLVAFQRHAVRQSGSLAVEADQAHYSGDIVVNAMVMLTLLAARYGAPVWIDTLCALGVAIYLGMTARAIAVKSLDVLMDRELPESERQVLINIIEAHPDVQGWHDLRTRRAGAFYVIAFDVEVNPDFSLRRAHDVAVDLERAMLLHYPYAEMFIHIDPEGHTHDARHRVRGIHT